MATTANSKPSPLNISNNGSTDSNSVTFRAKPELIPEHSHSHSVISVNESEKTFLMTNSSVPRSPFAGAPRSASAPNGGGVPINGIMKKNVIPAPALGVSSAFESNRPRVVAVEEDEEDDFIPGPPEESKEPEGHRKPISFKSLFGKGNKSPGRRLSASQNTNGIASSKGSADRLNFSDRLTKSQQKKYQEKHAAECPANHSHRQHHLIHALPDPSLRLIAPDEINDGKSDELDLSLTEHRIKGNGILASRADLDLAPEEFAAGCNLLQAAAAGDMKRVQELLQNRPGHVDFRDYDRRTALHVAASEGHLAICKYLVEVKKAQINRSDRWGGSPLDDAHRHRHHDVVLFLRQQGAITGSGNQSTNLITAAAEGDVDEVRMLLTAGGKVVEAIVSKGDYDRRTPLHLAASEGHTEIVKLLCNAHANVNAEDRWGSRPLDDALKAEQPECAAILKRHGAIQSEIISNNKGNDLDAEQTRRENDNLKVDFEELEMVDRIGSGAFGEIFKCRWRGTMVAAKCIKSAKIRQDWVNKRALESIEAGADVDEAMRIMDEAEMEKDEKEEALNDFRQEISVLKSLRHPHIVLLLAFSTTENYEVMISELMECSLLDVFKAHQVHGTRLAKRSSISYAIQLARGMNYLHTW